MNLEIKEIKNYVKVITNKVRASYAHLLTPVAMVEGGQEKYSCSFIIPKSDTETIAKINAAIDAALEERIAKFGGKSQLKVQSVLF